MAATVITVDPNSGAGFDFTTIQAALDAHSIEAQEVYDLAEGYEIQCRSGECGAFDISSWTPVPSEAYPLVICNAPGYEQVAAKGDRTGPYITHTSGNGCLIREPWVTIRGLRFFSTGSSAAVTGLLVQAQFGADNVTIENNVVELTADTSHSMGIRCDYETTATGTKAITIRRNIVYGNDVALDYMYGILVKASNATQARGDTALTMNAAVYCNTVSKISANGNFGCGICALSYSNAVADYNRTVASVNAGTDTITFTAAHSCPYDGYAIKFTTTVGDLPAPLDTATTYYTHVESATEITLFDTRANAWTDYDGTMGLINLTDGGSGTHTGVFTDDTNDVTTINMTTKDNAVAMTGDGECYVEAETLTGSGSATVDWTTGVSDYNAGTDTTATSVCGGANNVDSATIGDLWADADANLAVAAGSPLIAAGVAIPGIATDAIGNPYKDPPSIGALEYIRPTSTGTSTTTARRLGLGFFP